MSWQKMFLGIFLVPFIFNPWGHMPFEIPKVSWILIWVALILGIFADRLVKGNVEIA